MKYILAAGGTGGHIYPAISIADEIKKKDKNSEIIFVGAKGRIEEKIVPSNGYKLLTIPITGFSRNGITKNFKTSFKFLNSLRLSKKIINNFKPDVVIGTGGFASFPVVFLASRMKIPTLIQEGNSYPGLVTKFLSQRVNKVVINFKDTTKYLKKNNNVIQISHPIRSSLKLIDRKIAAEFFELNSLYKTIFIFGGSQGAHGINIGIDAIAEKLYKRNINLIWQTGQSDYKSLSEKYLGYKDKIRVLEFINNIDYAFSACDLVICRAGITSIMELAYLQKAAILVPYPQASENHQELNARSLEKENACKVVLQNEMQERLYPLIDSLLYDDNEIKVMENNIKKFSNVNAAESIANEAIKLTENCERN